MACIARAASSTCRRRFDRWRLQRTAHLVVRVAKLIVHARLLHVEARHQLVLVQRCRRRENSERRASRRFASRLLEGRRPIAHSARNTGSACARRNLFITEACKDSVAYSDGRARVPAPSADASDTNAASTLLRRNTMSESSDAEARRYLGYMSSRTAKQRIMPEARIRADRSAEAARPRPTLPHLGRSHARRAETLRSGCDTPVRQPRLQGACRCF